MITIKTPSEIEAMRAGGRITAAALKKVLGSARPGVALRELERLADEEISRRGGEPAFKRVKGYSFATCLNVNGGIVHGIPNDRKLKEGDLLSADLGTYYKGLNTDSSWTVYVGDEKQAPPDKIKFLAAGREALDRAVAAAVPGNRVDHISAAMQEVIEGAGYTPVDTLVGHGIGRDLHEDPQIPCLVLHGKGPALKEGMTLAIEAIYTEGSPKLRIEEDEWTISTADGGLSGLFEQTVAVTAEGPIILTERE